MCLFEVSYMLGDREDVDTVIFFYNLDITKEQMV